MTILVRWPPLRLQCSSCSSRKWINVWYCFPHLLLDAEEAEDEVDAAKEQMSLSFMEKVRSGDRYWIVGTRYNTKYKNQMGKSIVQKMLGIIW